MAVILDGKALAAKVRAQVTQEVGALEARGIQPGLAVILAGDNPASKLYVASKERACAACGIRSQKYLFPDTAGTEELTALIGQLNADPDTDGILVQLPLPAGCDRNRVLWAIDPEKDVDMLHPVNQGLLAAGETELAPCTPAGILRLLDEYGIDPDGKRCCVIGRSELVGRPVSVLLSRRNGTVTICHTHTRNLGEHTRQADILVSAAGVRELITADMVKPGAAVVDVGMNRRADGKLCGDVAYEAVSRLAGWITPVPGGCGPMTIAMLMANTLSLAKRRRGVDFCHAEA